MTGSSIVHGWRLQSWRSSTGRRMWCWYRAGPRRRGPSSSAARSSKAKPADVSSSATNPVPFQRSEGTRRCWSGKEMSTRSPEAAALVLSDPEEFHARRRSGLALAHERTWTCVARQQAEFYRAAMEEGRIPLLAGSPRTRRQLAVAEFGRPAEALGQSRPFALPYLRRPERDEQGAGPDHGHGGRGPHEDRASGMTTTLSEVSFVIQPYGRALARLVDAVLGPALAAVRSA